LARDHSKIDLHLKQWKHNRSLITSIPITHPDWIVTVIFYMAVHAVDAALAFESARFWNHETRFEAIGGIPRFKKIGQLYHPLYDLSRKARYTADLNQWIPPSLIDKQVLRSYLMPLENAVATIIGKDMRLPPPDLSRLMMPPSPKQ